MRTVTIPVDDSALDSSVMRGELQTLESEISNTSTGHDHDGSDSKAVDHVNLSNKGTNTHSQIDTALTRLADTSGLNTGDVTLPVKATAAEINAGSDDAKFATAAAIAGSFIGEQGGWINLGAATYEGADAPTYTISFASDMTTTLGAGMRIKLTDSTVKYFIITAVGAYSGGKTIITIYGGTDYTLSGGAITLPHYSIQKSPFGFPLSPTKWTVEVADTSDRNQATPTQNTWYNIGTTNTQISIPIGCWKVSYNVNLYANDNSTICGQVYGTLSTANNSESDADFTVYVFSSITGATDNSTMQQIYREKIISAAAKTLYYLNARTITSGIVNIFFQGAQSKTILRAVCAYL